MTLPDKFKCVFADWEHIHDLCRNVSNKIKESGYEVDTIVALARGGWVAGRILCDFLLLKNLYSINVEHWGVVATITKKAEITNPLNIDIKGRKILVADDITDTGDSIKVVLDHLRALEPKEVRTAVLQHKASSAFEPDFYGEILEDWNWIIYPWNFYEDLTHLVEQILVQPMTSENINLGLKGEFDISIDESKLTDVLENMLFHKKVERDGKLWTGVDQRT